MRLLLIKLCFPFILLAILYKPFFGILFFILTGFIRPEAISWGVESLHIALITSLAILAGWLLRIRDPREQNRFIPAQFWLYLVVMVGMIASAIGADVNQELAWKGTQKFVKYSAFLFLMIQMINTEKRLEQVHDVIFWGVSFLVVWGFEQNFRGNYRLEGVGGGDFKDSSDLAALIVLMIPLTLARTLHPVQWKRWSAWFLLPFYFIVLSFTLSRSGFLGAVVMLGVLFLRAAHRSRYVIGAIIVGSVLVIAMPDTFADRMATIFEPVEHETRGEERERSADSRLKLWVVAWAVAKDNPMLGVGRYNFGHVHESYAASIWYGEIDSGFYADLFYRYRVCHNTFLDLVVSHGFLTFVPWCLLMFSVPYSLFRARRYLEASQLDRYLRNYSYGLEAGILGFLVVGIFQDLTEMEAFYWMIILAGIQHSVLQLREARKAATAREGESIWIRSVRELVPSPTQIPPTQPAMLGNPWHT